MNITISLTPELNAFVKAKVETGRYGSISEVMRQALRLLEQADLRHAAELERLRTAYNEGKASGVAGPYDMERIVEKARERMQSET
jgi:antitoxin ParD1/3/4